MGSMGRLSANQCEDESESEALVRTCTRTCTCMCTCTYTCAMRVSTWSGCWQRAPHGRGDADGLPLEEGAKARVAAEFE